MAKVSNGLKGQWIAVKGTDDEVSAVAAWNAPEKRLSLVLVNFKARYSAPVIAYRTQGPASRTGWRYLCRWTIDATHSNVWNDRSHAELEQTGSGTVGPNDQEESLAPNSVTLLEFSAPR